MRTESIFDMTSKKIAFQYCVMWQICKHLIYYWHKMVLVIF